MMRWFGLAFARRARALHMDVHMRLYRPTVLPCAYGTARTPHQTGHRRRRSPHVTNEHNLSPKQHAAPRTKESLRLR
jgi:hypothetical protein